MSYISFKKIWEDSVPEFGIINFAEFTIIAENESIRSLSDFYMNRKDFRNLEKALRNPKNSSFVLDERQNRNGIVNSCKLNFFQEIKGKVNIEIEMKTVKNDKNFNYVKFDLGYEIELSMIDEFLLQLNNFYKSQVGTEIKLG